MENVIELIMQNIGAFIGVVGGGGGLAATLITRNGRRRDKALTDERIADAQAKMIANYEERLKDLHLSIDKQNEQEKYYTERISEQNKIIDSKTDQIRQLTEKLWVSEQSVNHTNNALDAANKRITELTEERDRYREWHCRKGECLDRIPPNKTLNGQKFHTPHHN